MENDFIKKDLFDLTFWFIGVFAILAFLFSIPLFFIFRYLHESFSDGNELVFYGLYALEMLIWVTLIGKFGMDYYLNQTLIENEQKKLLLRNILIFFGVLILFQIPGPFIYLIINTFVLGLLYLYVSYRIKQA